MKPETSRRHFLLGTSASALCITALPDKVFANLTVTDPGWRYCGSCGVLFHEDSGTGACAGNAAGHTAIGFLFSIVFRDGVCGDDSPRYQSRWRKCADCLTMYYNGEDATEICPAGGEHSADRDKCYELATNRLYAEPLNPENEFNQGAWRYCGRCGALFYDGYLDNKGVCPAGGAHAALGDVFVLTHRT